MSKKERYTIKTGSGKIIKLTNDIKEALNTKEEYKHEGAFIEDRKSPAKHKNSYIH
ncbi:MAG: hypothetical protein P9L97_12170 [Candidatus Tenebribacter davisii]|jgi:hypothetical protein|nr:hypothetical protein [Candidatus Tenebribacter davisii]